MRFSDIPQFPRFNYQVNIPWNHLENALADYAETGLDLDPDFQRAHVWSEGQQISYIEYCLKGGEVGRSIIFNNTGTHFDWGTLVLIDGKQRLEAVRKFMRNELPVFGTLYSEFEDSFRITQSDFIFKVCNLQSREEVLLLYLHINAGGTPHTKEELDKVRAMLTKEWSKR